MNTFLLSFAVGTAIDAVPRYTSILKTFKKIGVMSKAFEKHKVNRNTVVSTASIGEVFSNLSDNAPPKETLLSFTKRCQSVNEGELKERIERMKAEGELLPKNSTNNIQEDAENGLIMI